MISRVSIVTGLMLCALSMVGMIYAPAKGTTQFMPMMAGIPILFLGIVGLNPHRRRITTLISVSIAAFAVAYALARFFQVISDHDPLSGTDQRLVLAMAIVCVAYTLTAILSVPALQNLIKPIRRI